MTVAARLRARRLAPTIARRAEDHRIPGASAVEALQLEALNVEWRRWLRDVPYYGDLARDNGLPQEFRSIAEFADRVPPTTRAAIQSDPVRRASTTPAPQLVRMTGGSTASPIQIPAWRSEVEHTGIDQWTARGWYGISPASRLFLLWGHAHLLGTGRRGWIAARRRRIHDALLGYLRFSAYDLRPESLRRAAERLLSFRPEYVVGYSVALDLFARENAGRASELRALALRAVIGTAEGFPAPDSVARLEELFGCPVAMEYGAAEVGVVAHTVPASEGGSGMDRSTRGVGNEGPYRVFWRSLLVEGQRSGPGRYAVRLTSLHPRCLPLVRYEIGDEIELDGEARDRVLGLTAFRRLLGRCNDYVVLADGTRIHSEAFTHAVRGCAGVRAYQIVHGDSGVKIRYVADRVLPAEDGAAIRSKLARVHPALAAAGFERVETIPQTRAGKTRMVVTERDPG